MRWSRFFRRRRKDAEVIEEMKSYLAEQIDENLARGMSPTEARRRAYLKLGNPQRVREGLWQQNTLMFLENLLRDFRYAVRTLGRSPGFTLIAVLVMALGIGANVALFTVVRSVLINPLPYRDPGQLYSIYEHDSHSTDPEGGFAPVAGGSFGEWQKTAQGMAEMSLLSPWNQYNVSGDKGNLPEKLDAAPVSANLFETLRVRPFLGRFFTPADDQPGAEATVILTYGFWKRRFNSDVHIVGQKIWLDARPFTIIGVLPSSFSYSGAFAANTIQLWTPAGHELSKFVLETFEDHEFVVVARLKPGVTPASLIQRLNAVQTQIRAAHPSPGVHDAVAGRSMLEDTVHEYKTSLYVLLSATGCVLFIACLNVASLLVARTAARSKELAIRAALGGGRFRLLRERLMESLALSLAGGVLGFALAWVAVQWLIRTRQDMNRVEFIHIDAIVILFTVGAVAVCAIFSGMISAASSGSRRILAGLQESSRGHSAGNARAGLRKILLVLEVGVTVVLLVGAGLLLKSYQRLRNADLGVPIDNVLTMRLSLPEARYKEAEKQVAFFEQLIERVRAVPGVHAAGLVSTAPGQGWGGDRLMGVLEHPWQSKDQAVDMMVRGADPGYFQAIGIPLQRGRIFRSDERLKRDHVVVLSESAAKQAFPNEDPIGKHVRIEMTGELFEVVGVVGNTRYQISEPIKPTLYWPIFGNGYSNATIIVRSAHDVDTLALPIQKIIGQMDPDLPVSGVMTMEESIGKATIGSQFDSILVMAFAVIALILAAAGLYGVLAYLVTQRTSEIGIRIALGAQRKTVLRLVLIDGLRPALVGLVVGLGASAAASRLIRSMLYETQPLDATVFATVAATLLLVAGFACLIPAWRASRLDPMQALRAD